MEKPDPLAGEPFSCVVARRRLDRHQLPRRAGHLLRGKAAERFAVRMDGADASAAQQLMARATGNFKRGNERS